MREGAEAPVLLSPREQNAASFANRCIVLEVFVQKAG